MPELRVSFPVIPETTITDHFPEPPKSGGSVDIFALRQENERTNEEEPDNGKTKH